MTNLWKIGGKVKESDKLLKKNWKKVTKSEKKKWQTSEKKEKWKKSNKIVKKKSLTSEKSNKLVTKSEKSHKVM